MLLFSLQIKQQHYQHTFTSLILTSLLSEQIHFSTTYLPLNSLSFFSPSLAFLSKNGLLLACLIFRVNLNLFLSLILWTSLWCVQVINLVHLLFHFVSDLAFRASFTQLLEIALVNEWYHRLSSSALQSGTSYPVIPSIHPKRKFS